MDDERAETVREWDSRSVEEGHAGLRALSEEGFSGAIEGGHATAFMTNGRIVGVAGGDLDDIEGRSLTAYEAPDDALPLLFAMQERGGEPRAQYYTEDTPIEEVNSTLEDGGFTGYIELSENVLSGDYYVVYHAGKSSNIAFVGSSRRLLTGDEAFERTADEVGIYQVVDASVDVIDLPGKGGAAAGASGGGEAGATDPSTAPVEGTDESEREEPAADPTTAPDESADDGAESEDDGGATGETEPTDDDAVTGETPYGGEIEVGAGLGTPASDDSDGGSAADALDRDTDKRSVPDVADDGPDPLNESGGTGGETPVGPAGDADAPAGEGGDGDAASGEGGDGDADGSAADSGDGLTDDAGAASSPGEGSTADATDDASDRIAALEATRDRLEADLEAVRDERDEFQAEAERLRERVATLERQIEALNSDDSTGEDGPSLSPDEALAGTNLFVRYRSKSEPTLAAAHDDGADREVVNENLRLEHHTTFDAGGATVEGKPFELFLEGTLEYQFVQWAVRELLYELRSTGNRRAMEALYDAFPEIDRIELGGEVRIGDETGDGEDDVREFDVIFRNRMGGPLAVADIHESRQPAGGEFAEQLIDDATAVAGDAETVGAAFAVTTSYYEPPALGAADEATGGGFLSRSRRKGYVKLGRSRGFHLCLVEARDGEFNLKVPEL